MNARKRRSIVGRTDCLLWDLRQTLWKIINIASAAAGEEERKIDSCPQNLSGSIQSERMRADYRDLAEFVDALEDTLSRIWKIENGSYEAFARR